ncbi:MAG: hypothetical protein ROO76_17660 [Terriglobia bacterium]|nr:hypothetical protein [Terriglobia bacterium]
MPLYSGPERDRFFRFAGAGVNFGTMKGAVVAGFLLIVAITLHAQASAAPLSVSVCQLTRDPALYVGKQIEVRGEVTRAFEDFSIHDERCPAFQNRVALAYGNRKEIVHYWRHFFHVQLPQIAFLQDEQAEEFDHLLQSFRVFAPDGDECGPELCSFFRVSARITGWFLAMKKQAKYLGPCCVLVMERISDVTETRTEVPFGGTYKCEDQEWRPTDLERAALVSSNPQVSPNRDPRSGRLLMFSRVAQHWHDPDVADGSLSITTGAWRSPDLLRQYAVQSLGKDQGLLVTRQVCHASAEVPTYQKAPDSQCTQKYWDASTQSNTPLRSNGDSQLESVARNAVAEAMASWHTQSPDLLLNTCKHQIGDNSDYGQCSFTTRDGTVSMWVELLRTQKRNKQAKYVWDGIPWRASRVRGGFCSQ